jgi:Bcr/CflA subfamily drug resistance transporter
MKNQLSVLILIALIACLSQFGSDIYVPAMPRIAIDLNTHVNWVQLSLTTYLFGIALSLLVYGALSEGLGRKKPLLMGLFIMVVGSVICLFSTGINQLLLGRFVQGLGAGASAGLWRAIFRDFFHGKALEKWGSYLSVVFIFIIPMAPVVGAYLLVHFHWPSIFALITVLAVVTGIAVCFGYTESSQHHHPSRLSIAFAYQNYKQCLNHRLFIGMTLCTFVTYGAFFTWFVVSPVLLISHWGLSPITYGYLNFITACVAQILGALFNARYAYKIPVAYRLRIASTLMVLSGILMWIGYSTLGQNIEALMGSAFIFFLGSTLIWPNAFAIAMTPFGKTAGYAGSMYAFIQLAGGAIVGSLVSHLPDNSPAVLAICLSLSGLLSSIGYETIVRPKQDN